MVKRSVVWTETTARQRREILKYWTIRNGSSNYAKELITFTADRIGIMLRHPKSFKSTSYSETRESAMGHFSIFYKLTNDKLIVTAFWDNRQDPKDLIKLLHK
jgi:plasmid stabilization system protein ParE